MRFNLNDSLQYVLAFQRGEEVGFDYFFHTYHRALVYYARRYVKDLQVAEDLVEDAFIHTWDKRKQFDAEGGIRAYLYRSVYNNCLRWLEREGKRDNIHKLYNAEMPVTETEHLENMIKSETIRQLNMAMEGLPEQCRKVFVKLFIEGKSVREAAEELSLSISNVKNQKARGIKILKDRLGDSLASWLL